MHICHLTSVHSRNDVRIFNKECLSLSFFGYQVSIIVADGLGDEFKKGVFVHDVGKFRGRLKRIFKTTRSVFEKARKLNADFYHLHDPELLPTGLKLKKLGKKVIFDAHEDFPKHILGKHYLNKPVRYVLSNIAMCYEGWACSKIDGVVAATPFIRDKFILINPFSVDVNNFPLLNEFFSVSQNWSLKDNVVCYVGGLGGNRGISEMIDAIGQVKNGTRLALCGRFVERDVENQARSTQGWQLVDEMGWLSREEIMSVFSRSVAGIVTLHPIVNYIDALPVKMFEYMAAGLPVIASNFPLWSEIVEGNQCGLCVDPLDPKAIAGVIDYLVMHPGEAEQMGRNGRHAVQKTYNWAIEEQKLIQFYRALSR